MYPTNFGPIAFVIVITLIIATVLGLFAGNIFGPVPEAAAYKTKAETDDFIKDEEAARTYAEQAYKARIENLPSELAAERQRKQIAVETWQLIGIILAFGFAASMILATVAWGVINLRQAEAVIALGGIPPPMIDSSRLLVPRTDRYHPIPGLAPPRTSTARR